MYRRVLVLLALLGMTGCSPVEESKTPVVEKPVAPARPVAKQVAPPSRANVTVEAVTDTTNRPDVPLAYTVEDDLTIRYPAFEKRRLPEEQARKAIESHQKAMAERDRYLRPQAPVSPARGEVIPPAPPAPPVRR